MDWNSGLVLGVGGGLNMGVGVKQDLWLNRGGGTLGWFWGLVFREGGEPALPC